MNLKVESVRPYSQSSKKEEQIESMFDNIAHRYDFLNHLLSAGVDILWRKRAIREIGKIHPRYILDMATGTGDFAFEALALNPTKVTAVDLSQNMLNIGRSKAIEKRCDHQIEFIKGNSESLDFVENSFDAITVGFGVRNFQDLRKGLYELHRVMKPGGIIAILEPSFPAHPLIRFLFMVHFQYLTPIIGKLFSKDARAYTYLPDSVEAFPRGEEFCKILSESGFRHTNFTPLTFGTCALYTASK